MFRRIAEWLGLVKKQDEALSRRFARMRALYGAPPSAATMDVLRSTRSGLTMRSVVGAEKVTSQQLRKDLIESYARGAEKKPEPVASK